MLYLAAAFEQYHTMNLINSLKSNEGWWKVYKEAVIWRCSVKKLFLEILQNSQEYTCAKASFLIKLQVSGLQLY